MINGNGLDVEWNLTVYVGVVTELMYWLTE